jgi:hypothetical protein
MKQNHLRAIPAPSSAPAPVSQLGEVEQINARLVELRTRDKALLAEQIELERTSRISGGLNANGADAAAATRQAAMRMLVGDENLPLPTPKRDRLREVIEEREVIAAAIELGDSKVTQLFFDRAIARRIAMHDLWCELQRDRALCIARLQRLNRESDKMLSTTRDPNGHTEMPAAFADRSPAQFLGGNGSVVGTDFHEFLALVVKLGIVTRGELEKERGNGA